MQQVNSRGGAAGDPLIHRPSSSKVGVAGSLTRGLMLEGVRLPHCGHGGGDPRALAPPNENPHVSALQARFKKQKGCRVWRAIQVEGVDPLHLPNEGRSPQDHVLEPGWGWMRGPGGKKGPQSTNIRNEHREEEKPVSSLS